MTAQHRRPTRHWQLLAAGLAAVTVGALATVTPGASADAAAPHAGTRAQVPWSRVGAGWTLATWAKSWDKGRPTLFLLAPDGHRYKITTIDPRSDIQDWSPDGRRVLVGDYDNHRREIDLHTGRSHVVRLPEGSYVGSYTRPNGRALLVDVNDRLERFDLRGHRQKTYPAKVRGSGWLNAGGIETADGTQLVVGAGKGMVVLRNNGSVVRRLMPKSHECHPVSFESATSLQASCSGRIWSVPLSGRRRTR